VEWHKPAITPALVASARSGNIIFICEIIGGAQWLAKASRNGWLSMAWRNHLAMAGENARNGINGWRIMA